MSLRVRQFAALLLLVVGVQAWLILGDGDPGHLILHHWLLGALLVWLGGALLGWFLPSVRNGLVFLLERIRHPSPRAMAWATVGITLGSAAYLPATAYFQYRPLGPVWHDQFCYLIQARILETGRLWLPAHPLGEFFDSFYLIVSPVYTPMYFPGTALMLAPALKLGLPVWATSLETTAMAVGLLYCIATELLDGVGGALAVLLLLGTSQFRWASMVIMAQAPAVLLGLLAIWAWLRWRRSGAVAWRWD